jgi:outer membrane protein assembly factor BamB
MGLHGCRDATGARGGVRVRWVAADDGQSQSRPAIIGSMVVFGAGGGRLVARDVATGELRWQTTALPSNPGGRRIVVVGAVIVASSNSYTVGLDTGGRVLWTYPAPLDSVRDPARPQPGVTAYGTADADSQTVFIPAWGASVSAVDARSGTVRWVWRPGVSVSDTAVAGRFRSGADGVKVAGDTVYVNAWHDRVLSGVTGEQWVVALDRLTGRELWRVSLPVITGGSMAQGAPALFGNLVMVVDAGGNIYAIDRTTVQLAWTYDAATIYRTFAEATVVDGILYQDGGDLAVYAIRASDGVVLWRTPLGFSATRDLLVTDRRVYYPSQGTIFILDRATGRVIAKLSTGDEANNIMEGPAAFSGGRVFVNFTSGPVAFDEP